MPGNSLQTSSGLPTTAPASSGCSPELWRLLTAKEPTRQIAPLIASDKALLAETHAVLANLETRQRPCGRVHVVGSLMPLVTVYGCPERSEDEWATFWSLYADALQDVPREALAEAVTLYTRQGVFFPKPAELYKLAQPAAERIRQAAWRAKEALRHEPRTIREPITPAQRAEFVAMMAAVTRPMPHQRRRDPLDVLDTL